jgi:hypothetical protein
VSTELAKSDQKAVAPVERVRLRYLGDKVINHSLTGLEFRRHVMHEMSRADADDLLHWTRGEEFEEIR